MPWTDPALHPYTYQEVVTAGTLNTYVKDNLLYLYAPIGCRVTNSAAQSIPNAAATNLLFNTNRWDTGGFHSVTTLTDRLVAPVFGYYYIFGHLSLAANATNQRQVWIGSNAGNTPLAEVDQQAPGAGLWTACVSTLWVLQAGDYVTLTVFQNSGVALNTNVAVQGNDFGMTRIGG